MVIFMELRGSGVPINGRKYMGELGVITCISGVITVLTTGKVSTV